MDAEGALGPIHVHQRVIILLPDLHEPKHGDFVVDRYDDRTTLKRVICKGEPCTLCATSKNSNFANGIKPAHDLVIQPVCVGNL